MRKEERMRLAEKDGDELEAELTPAGRLSRHLCAARRA